MPLTKKIMRGKKSDSCYLKITFLVAKPIKQIRPRIFNSMSNWSECHREGRKWDKAKN